MKLLYCSNCGDVFSLRPTTRTCMCGATEGKYNDDLFAEYKGEYAIPLFIANSSFNKAINNRPHKAFDHTGKNLFTAGVIEFNCSTFKDLTDENSSKERKSK